MMTVLALKTKLLTTDYKMVNLSVGRGEKLSTKKGAGLTAKGVAKYKRANPGSKLKTAVTGKVKAGSKDAKRRKSFCARSKGWTSERGKAARKRWKC
tara:strand:- start:166 stop:456 length:291 start_codon:yes stop_codon:yes gene_type:complete